MLTGTCCPTCLKVGQCACYVENEEKEYPGAVNIFELPLIFLIRSQEAVQHRGKFGSGSIAFRVKDVPRFAAYDSGAVEAIY